MRKLMLILKLMTSHTGKLIITIHTMPNISSKDNQIMESGQLIEYNMANIFIQKSCRKWGRDTSYTPIFVF